MMQFGGPSQSKTDDFEFLWFSQLLGRAVSYGEGSNQAGPGAKGESATDSAQNIHHLVAHLIGFE